MHTVDFAGVRRCHSVYRFSCYTSRGKDIIGRVLKFAGYIYDYKTLADNIFGLILKNKMAAMCVFQLSARSFVTPLEQKVS